MGPARRPQPLLLRVRKLPPVQRRRTVLEEGEPTDRGARGDLNELVRDPSRIRLREKSS